LAHTPVTAGCRYWGAGAVIGRNVSVIIGQSPCLLPHRSRHRSVGHWPHTVYHDTGCQIVGQAGYGSHRSSPSSMAGYHVVLPDTFTVIIVLSIQNQYHHRPQHITGHRSIPYHHFIIVSSVNNVIIIIGHHQSSYQSLTQYWTQHTHCHTYLLGHFDKYFHTPAVIGYTYNKLVIVVIEHNIIGYYTYALHT
jgi:hypothetical protein